jgi:hypothetical protein
MDIAPPAVVRTPIVNGLSSYGFKDGLSTLAASVLTVAVPNIGATVITPFGGTKMQFRNSLD